MALPVLDNHDPRVRYYELLLERDARPPLPQFDLPAGWRFETYAPGDRDAWIAIERSAKELASYQQGLEVWDKYYRAHEAELPGRMFFLVNAAGEKAATATAFYDVIHGDPEGAGWLHWVAVRREDQGKGLARPLIRRALERLRELGYRKLKIPTQTTTWVAARLYLDFGFRTIPENAVHSREGWRILRRLTDHPALAEFPPASDEEVLIRPEIRLLTPALAPAVLPEFLYQAIFVPPGEDPPPRSILEKPELRVYLRDFGDSPGDTAMAAYWEGRPIGAAWARIMDDYGHLDDDTPSLAIALLPEYRGMGLGSELLAHLLDRLAQAGYGRASLAVQKRNPARRLYRRLGFQTVGETPEEYLMARPLGPALVRLRDRPELLDRAAGWFHEKWGVPLAAYQESMAACLSGDGPVPQWYLALDGERIAGGLGVIENDFHNRKDLAPNVCAVFVEEDFRGRGLAGRLLALACQDMASLGVPTLYLLTDHEGFYERYGWEFYGTAQSDGDPRPSRVYVHRWGDAS